MSKQFTITIRNIDLSEVDVYMALEQYTDKLFEDGEIDDILAFEVVSMD